MQEHLCTEYQELKVCFGFLFGEKQKKAQKNLRKKSALTSSDMPLMAELAADFFAPSVAARAVLCAPAIKQVH